MQSNDDIWISKKLNMIVVIMVIGHLIYNIIHILQVQLEDIPI